MTHEGTSYDLFLDRFKPSEAKDWQPRPGDGCGVADALVQSRARAIKFALFLSMKRVGESPGGRTWTWTCRTTWVEPDEEPGHGGPGAVGCHGG